MLPSAPAPCAQSSCSSHRGLLLGCSSLHLPLASSVPSYVRTTAVSCTPSTSHLPVGVKSCRLEFALQPCSSASELPSLARGATSFAVSMLAAVLPYRWMCPCLRERFRPGTRPKDVPCMCSCALSIQQSNQNARRPPCPRRRFSKRHCLTPPRNSLVKGERIVRRDGISGVS